MSVTNTSLPRIIYIGNDITTIFPITFAIGDTLDIKVFLRELDDSENIEQTEGVDFNVSGSDVVMTTAPILDAKLIIERKTPQEQSVDIKQDQVLSSTVREKMADDPVLMIQELKEDSSRALKFGIETDTSVINVDFPAPDADKFIGWNNTADALINITLSDGSTPIPTTPNTLLGVDSGGVLENVTDTSLTEDRLVYQTQIEMDAGIIDNKPVSSDTVQGWVVPYVSSVISALPSQKFDKAHILGLLTSNDITDPDHDIVFGTGECRSSDNTIDIIPSTSLTKQIDAIWVAGDNAGGLADALTVAADTTYHLFVLSSADELTTDFGFDTSLTAVNLLADANVIAAGLTKFRRVGSVVTDGASNIIPSKVLELAGGGVDFRLDQIQERSSTSEENPAVLFPVTCPPNVLCHIQAFVSASGSEASTTWISDFDENSKIKLNTNTGGDRVTQSVTTRDLLTDGNSNIKIFHDNTAGAVFFELFSTGWIDQRID